MNFTQNENLCSKGEIQQKEKKNPLFWFKLQTPKFYTKLKLNLNFTVHFAVFHKKNSLSLYFNQQFTSKFRQSSFFFFLTRIHFGFVPENILFEMIFSLVTLNARLFSSEVRSEKNESHFRFSVLACAGPLCVNSPLPKLMRSIDSYLFLSLV